MSSAAPAPSFEVDLSLLRSWFGVGVAGNFAGHLEQAGEAADFRGVDAAPDAPKGIFPFYAPGHDLFLSTFPLSHEEIAPPTGDGANASPTDVGVSLRDGDTALLPGATSVLIQRVSGG